VIDRSYALSAGQQARVLAISRSSIHAVPQPPSATDFATTRRIDELHLMYPFAGSRTLRALLAQEGIRDRRSRCRCLPPAARKVRAPDRRALPS
jgi:putative transposase